MQGGHNQYPPMTGVPALAAGGVGQNCRRCTRKIYQPGQRNHHHRRCHTGHHRRPLLAIVHPGDEVIVLEPCYDSYVPNIELAGGVVVRVPLMPGTFRPDFAKISAAITSKTRAILINTPHNPSATVWSRSEMLALQRPAGPHQHPAHQ